MEKIIRYIFRFVCLVMVQTLVLNNIELFGYINPMLYVVFILLLPFDIPYWGVILLGFGLGFCVDVFSDTYGLHTAATTLLAFARPYLVRLALARNNFQQVSTIQPATLNRSLFMMYALWSVIAHHLMFYLVDAFTTVNILYILIRIVVGSVLTLVFIYIYVCLFLPKKSRNDN